MRRLAVLAAVVGLLVVGAASFADSAPDFIARVENRLGLPHIGEATLHFAGWMVVTILVMVAVRGLGGRVVAVGGILLLGLVIEFLQPALSSSRSFESEDIVANLLGIAVGVLVGSPAARWWDRVDPGDGGDGGGGRTATFLASNMMLLVVAGLMAVAGLGFAFLIGLDPMIMGLLLLAVGVVAIVGYRLLGGGPVDWTEPPDGGRVLGSTLVALLIVGLGIQVIPYGRDHTNPPVTAEPEWDSPETRALAVRACFDCHSNEVSYPWYAGIAPMSWAIQSHVERGRAEVNYSDWDRPQEEASESAETVRDGEMPPDYYTRFAHADARLSEAETRRLVEGLVATFGDDD